MARSPSKRFRRVYWDSCTWISLIQNETAVPLPGGGTENRASLARAVLSDAEKGAAEIITSALSLAEVSKPATDPGSDFQSADKLAAFFENDFIVISMLDRTVGESARRLMQARYPGLKPLDAVHVASALAANVDEMHSFDQKLLDLDDKLEKLDGKPLKVCKPAMGGPPLPLLESPPQVLDPSQDDEENGVLTEVAPMADGAFAENEDAEATADVDTKTKIPLDAEEPAPQPEVQPVSSADNGNAKA